MRMNKIDYYKMLTIYGIICLVIIFPAIFVFLFERVGMFELQSGLKIVFQYSLPLLAIIGLILIYPLLCDKATHKCTKSEFIISGICFIFLGMILGIMAVLSNTHPFMKYIVFPALAILLFIYGLSFICKCIQKENTKVHRK